MKTKFFIALIVFYCALFICQAQYQSVMLKTPSGTEVEAMEIPESLSQSQIDL